VLVLAIVYFAAVYLGDNLRFKMLVEKICLVSKPFFGVPTFFDYAAAYGLCNVLFADKAGLHNALKAKKPEFRLPFSFLGRVPGARGKRQWLEGRAYFGWPTMAKTHGKVGCECTASVWQSVAKSGKNRQG
jgi:hypothetical protein